MRPVIIVHGGAGRVAENGRAEREEGCRDAAAVGWQCIRQGGRAMDAVEEAVAFLEDHPLFNAGRGSVLNSAGDVETDASLMDGQTLRSGAVGALRNVRNPIRLARRILEHGKHVLLVGEGAVRFARDAGIATCAPEELITDRQRARWETSKESGFGTVGAVALDGTASIAAATSTGGLVGKLPGRVGDSALIGSGTYADHLLGAASATGDGEAIIRVVLAKTAVDLLAGSRHPVDAARMAIATLGRLGEGRRDGGIILVDRMGRVGHAYNAPSMLCAVMDGTTAAPTLLTS